MTLLPGVCAVDFGTSNSAVALPDEDGRITLVALEGDHCTMPTAVFYPSDDDSLMASQGLPAARAPCLQGRAAVAAYVEGHEGRLMRSMKSILGSSLLRQHTDIGAGRSLSYADVVTGYLRSLKVRAERAAGSPLQRVVLGRPVHFVDDDPARDRQAEQALRDAALAVGFEEVHFQFEPIAAALDHESRLDREALVLVADIGGGTSDFSLIRLSPERRRRRDREDDILANHGVHVAGTDFDRHLSIETIMRALGYGSQGPSRGSQPGRVVPSSIYFELATWHLINLAYAPSRMAEVRALKGWYAEPAFHQRLMRVLTLRLGHALAAAAEQAKIDAASLGRARIDLSGIEAGLFLDVDERAAGEAIEADLQQIESAAVETVRRAGLSPEAVQAVYLTGGSTALQPLAHRILGRFGRAQAVRGDPFASVARGLGESAARRWGRAL